MNFRISVFLSTLLAVMPAAGTAWSSGSPPVPSRAAADSSTGYYRAAADTPADPAGTAGVSTGGKAPTADSPPAPGGADSSSAMAGAVEGGARPVPGDYPLETGLFRLINGSAANPLFDSLMPFITDLNKWKIALLLVWCALVLFGGAKGRWAALMLIPLIAASDQICSSVIKPLAARMRPCEVLGNVHLWNGAGGWITTPSEATGGYKTSFSFPSSHAANITASMLFLGLVYRKLLGALLVAAAAVSYSRIYTGVHWPLDAAAGMILGAVLALAAYWLFGRIAGPERGAAVKTNESRDTDASK